MVRSMLRRVGLGVAALSVSAMLAALIATPAEAHGRKRSHTSLSVVYHAGPYYRPSYRPYYPYDYYPPRVVYAPPPVYYAPPPPVVYQAPPAYYGPPQTLPGGPLVSQTHCREYQSTSVVNGQTVASYGTACLQPDGSWRMVR